MDSGAAEAPVDLLDGVADSPLEVEVADAVLAVEVGEEDLEEEGNKFPKRIFSTHKMKMTLDKQNTFVNPYQFDVLAIIINNGAIMHVLERVVPRDEVRGPKISIFKLVISSLSKAN